MQPAPTPARIVEADGTVHTGWFAQPFTVANLDEAPARHWLARLRNTAFEPLERGARRWRLKQWHYTSVVTDRLFFACAIVDAGYVGNAFAYVVDRASGRKHEYSVLTPAGAGVTIAPNSVDGTSRVSWPGFGSIALHNDAQTGIRRVECDLQGRSGAMRTPPLRARLSIRDSGTRPDPIVVVEETEPGRWLYTHKCYALDAGGTVHCGELSEEVALGKALAGIDWNRGFRPRETYWNWAAGTGHASDGTRVGFNLTAHRRPNEGAPHEDAGDCALWIGDRTVKLGSVGFGYDDRNLLGDWRIRDDEGLVELRFTPDGERAEDVNFGVVVSRFHQPYGRFFGTIADRDGKRYTVDGLYGVVEQHFARW